MIPKDEIMIIDDDPEVIKHMKRDFAEYNIIGFTRGEDALKYLEKLNEVQLIFLDIHMPGSMDGRDVLEEIRKINQKVEVIILTGFNPGDETLVIETLSNHRARYFLRKPHKIEEVAKPYNIEEVRDKIKRIMKGKANSIKFSTYQEEIIERIKLLIDHSAHDVVLSEAAEIFHKSPAHLGRLFQKVAGQSFRDYKIKVKIDKAKLLLEDFNLSIDEIASQLYYENTETFVRIFKLKVKMTPTHYRKQILHKYENQKKTKAHKRRTQQS